MAEVRVHTLEERATPDVAALHEALQQNTNYVAAVRSKLQSSLEETRLRAVFAAERMCSFAGDLGADATKPMCEPRFPHL